jgi:hypothetical protein
MVSRIDQLAYAANGVEFTREREFVVKDCDGRLLAFGSNL